MAKKEINFKEERTSLKPVSSQNMNNAVNPEVFYEGLNDNLSYFTPENTPESYNDLKKEVKVLAEIHARTFIILAHRLKIIRDNELYKEDGYIDFKSFVESELEIARSTVYNYLTILELFGVQDLGHDIKTYNLIQALPIIKKYPEKKEDIFKASQDLKNKEFQAYLKSFKNQELKEKIEEEIEEKDWYSSKDELIANSKFLREGMKAKTLNKMLKEITNLLYLENPKDKTIEKIRKILY